MYRSGREKIENMPEINVPRDQFMRMIYQRGFYHGAIVGVVVGVVLGIIIMWA